MPENSMNDSAPSSGCADVMPPPQTVAEDGAGLALGEKLDAKKSAVVTLEALHADHACIGGPCECKCGICEAILGCKVIMGPLCSHCLLRYYRDDDDVHGLREDDARASAAPALPATVALAAEHEQADCKPGEPQAFKGESDA